MRATGLAAAVVSTRARNEWGPQGLLERYVAIQLDRDKQWPKSKES